jgi:GNAT superfamily N-acetyltransferase
MERPYLRQLRPDELDVAYRILVSASEWLTSKGIRQWTTAYPKQLYWSCHANGWNHGLICDGQLAVILTLSPETPAEWTDSVGTAAAWWLSKLATAPRYRGRGVGALALREVIEYLSAQGAERLCLDCVYGNGFLVDFYQRLGFKTIDRRDVSFPTGLFDMVLMELKLAKSLDMLRT